MKKKDEHKEIKDNLTKSIKIDNSNLTKTPSKSNRKRELDFKGKTEIAPKKTKVFSGKSSYKPELTTIPAEKSRKKPAPLLTESRRKSADKKLQNKKSLNKKHEDNEDNKTKKSHIYLTAYKQVGSKRFTNQKKPIEKKSGMKSGKKNLTKQYNMKKSYSSGMLVPASLANKNICGIIPIQVSRNAINNKNHYQTSNQNENNNNFKCINEYKFKTRPMNKTLSTINTTRKGKNLSRCQSAYLKRNIDNKSN